MLEGLYSAAAGMEAQQSRLDEASNDLANVSTTGYKRARVSFRDLLYSPAGPGAAAGQSIGAGAAAAVMGRSYFVQGALQATGQPLDVALQGPGFFEVRRADGTTALTRNGAFSLNANGRLVDSDGNFVQPPITAPKGTTAADLKIGTDGAVTANGRRLGKLAVVDVPSPDGLAALGSTLFQATAASGAPRAAGSGTQVTQGSLESSNVDMADAMVDLMTAQRSYELASKAIHLQDQMAEIANGIKR